MNLIDRAIAAVSPRAGLRRAHARMALDRISGFSSRSYAGAARGERLRGFASARGSSANSEIGPALATLRDRARSLVRNTAHGARIVDVWVAHAVGTGITPVWDTGSSRTDRQVTALWDAWVRSADVGGELDFYGLQALVARAAIEGGEALVRFVPVRYETGTNIVPLRLQPLEGDHIDSSRDGSVDGRRVRLGVVLGDWDRREGFYVYRRHPGEALLGSSMVSWLSEYLPRSTVTRVYRPTRIGQVRGVTRFAPIVLTARDYADLVEATLVKANVEACFAGFYSEDAEPPTSTDAKGNKVMRLEPGTLTRLPAGADIKFAQPTSNSQFDAIAINMLQAMAVGAGLTYDQVAGDLRQANYSSLRAGKIEHRRLVEQDQWHMLVPMLCDPVADQFVEMAVLAGLLRPRAGGYPRKWVMPAIEPIDPKKDLEADISAVRAGRMSPQEFIAAWGRDWRKVLDDFSGFIEELDRRNLSFDIDPRRPLRGAAQGAEPSNTGGDTSVADGDKPIPPEA